jgi:hypothetical protein
VTSATEIPTNDAVEWHGTRYGLMPRLSAEAERIAARGEEAIPGLLHALRDPDRFVAAHVLLTQIAGDEYETFPSWNGLRVSLEPDDGVAVDPGQREQLARRWQGWYGRFLADD